MALIPIASKHQFPLNLTHFPSSKNTTKTPQMALQNTTFTRRRTSLTLLLSSTLFYIKFQNTKANAFEFRLVAPEQTLEEAENGIKSHAQDLLKVKELLEEGSWKGAQKELRMNSGYLKQDLYTIIQNRPGVERAELRKLYADLFNSVTRLDYAARDKDVPRIWECYNNIVVALERVFSRIT